MALLLWGWPCWAGESVGDAVEGVGARAVELYPEQCDAGSAIVSTTAPSSYQIRGTVEVEQGVASASDEVIVVGEPCSAGVYNVNYVFFLLSADGKFSPLSFARPRVEWGDGGDPLVSGWWSGPLVTNASWDQESSTISGFARGRGLGDAGARGVWRVDQNGATLLYYERDDSYDGSYNPSVIFSAPGFEVERFVPSEI